MGLFDFVKDAGEKLFGRDEASPAAQPGAAARSAADAQADRAKGETLTRMVDGLGLSVEHLNIHYREGVATLHGSAASQADREKVVLVVGNTQGVARVDDRLVVAEPAPQAKFHTVVSGDTLSKIAKHYYGDAMKYPVIFEANKPMLKDPDKIYPGQVLRIPPMD